MIKLQMLLVRGADVEGLRKAARELGIIITSTGAASAVGEIDPEKFAEVFGGGADEGQIAVPEALKPFVQTIGVPPKQIYLR